MNVGIVTYWGERGAGHVSRAYERALSRGHSVFVLARGADPSCRGRAGWDGPNVTWSRVVPGLPPDWIEPDDLAAFARRHAIDLLLFNEQHGWETVLAARELPVLVGAYVDYYTPETVPFFRLYDFLLCNTRRHHGVFADHPQALFVPWGTDLSLFRPRAGSVTDGCLTFFHSSGMNPWRKGTDLALRAFSQVTGPARLVIHAQAPLERRFAEWQRAEEGRAACAIAESDPRITVLVREVGPPGLYHLGDVYAYPTRLDGVGLTVAEACASGAPVVATDVGPMDEMVAPGVNGALVPVEREEPRFDGYYWPETTCRLDALVAAMQSYVDRRGEIDALRAASRAQAEAHLDWSVNAARLHEDLRGLVRRRDLAGDALLAQVRQFEARTARFAWLPRGVEIWLRRHGATTAWATARRLLHRPARMGAS